MKSSIIDIVSNLAQPATFTFEFYPRVEGNIAEYDISP